MAAAHAYPVRVEPSLDAPPSRRLWLFKWILVVPHYFVLGFLWVTFVVLSAVAMLAIVVTGRYPLRDEPGQSKVGSGADHGQRRGLSSTTVCACG
jgi:hypothetical protein